MERLFEVADEIVVLERSTDHEQEMEPDAQDLEAPEPARAADHPLDDNPRS
jgi:hypothetical protein